MKFHWMLLPAGLSVLAMTVAAEPVSPFDIGDRAQLFVDQVLVRSSEGLAYTLHPAIKHPLNPLVKPDKPWEGWRAYVYGSVIHDEDEGLFKMWYYAEAPDYFPNTAVYYATSRDGITWEKPLVGTIHSGKLAQHNAVADGLHLPSVIKDSSDPDPNRRYKMICWDWPNMRYATYVSPDGLNWSPFSPGPICPGGDVITGYYDRARGLYVAFPKIGAPVRGHSRRVFWVTTSKDFQTWTEPKLAIYPDLRDDAGSLARIEEARPLLDVPDNPNVMRTEFYGTGVYQAESCTLAFPWVFTINNNDRGGNQDGPCELQLAVSRDLENWERPFRVPCVPQGKIGEWDCGFSTSASEAIRVGDEVWLYYGGSNYSHGGRVFYDPEGKGRGTEFTAGIGLATWKLDRFVSVDAGREGGTLTTVPIVFDGNRLELNAATHAGGSITVEVLDLQGKVLARSDPFAGDDLRAIVSWADGTRVARLAGKPVTLRFSLRDAQLYSFAFRRGPATRSR